jgi:deazaflavin-dependent oxidoreductase (nitroreductase family)
MEEFPRKGSALYDMLRGDAETRKRSLATWKRMNRAVVFLYELRLLPLIGIGRYILLLYTVGRKSGKARVNPLEYRRRDDTVLLFSARGKASDWYRNLKAHPEKAEIRIGFKRITPVVEFIDDSEKIEEIMRWYIQKFPGSGKMLFGWDPKKDNIENADLSSLSEAIKIVQLGPI